MQIPARLEYAWLALIELASCYDRKEPLKICEITARQPMPDRYLEQILTQLRHSGIVQSQRGANGGYMLTKAPWQISLREVLISLEGNQSEKQQGESNTVEKSLVLEVYQEAKRASQAILDRYTLEDLHQRRVTYLQTDPMYHI